MMSSTVDRSMLPSMKVNGPLAGPKLGSIAAKPASLTTTALNIPAISPPSLVRGEFTNQVTTAFQSAREQFMTSTGASLR